MTADVGIYVIPFLWVIVLVCLLQVIGGRRRLLFWMFFFFASTVTLQANLVYAVVDPLLGGLNLTYHFFHVTGILACALLDCIIQAAVSPKGLTTLRKRVVTAAALAVIVLQTVLFFVSDWGRSDTIREGYFGTWDYLLYVSGTWVSLLLLAGSGCVACWRDLRTQKNPVLRVAVQFVCIGCVSVLLYVGITFPNALFATVDPTFNVKNMWTLVVFPVVVACGTLFIGLGLGLPVLINSAIRLRRFACDVWYLRCVTPLWERLCSHTPEVSVDINAVLWGRRGSVFRDPGACLYRRYVEVRDSLFLSPGQMVSGTERQLMDRIEQHVSIAAARVADVSAEVL
jgi:hypothetical protein